MRLIPSTVFEFPSAAEAKVFHILEAVEAGNDWIALHSLNCSEHAYKQWSEIDFLVIASGTVLVLEVKGGGVSYHEGVWLYENRYGRVTQNTEGPFNQAKSARFALEHLLKGRFGLAAFERRPIFGFGVLLPDTPWSVESPEMPRVLVADRDQCRTVEGLGTYLRGLRSYWAAKFPAEAGLTPSDRRRLVQVLRPDIDIYPPFTLRLGQVVSEMQSLTDEQYERLDMIEANRQAIISGGAGTGKTFLLMQCARRDASQDKRVLVVTESKILASYLRKLEPRRDIRIVDFDSLEGEPAELSDVLLVDEGQDLLSLTCFQVLSKQIVGGMEGGTWRWFMDENRQSRVGGTFDPEALEMLEAGLGRHAPVRLPLRRNVRNTKEIIATVEAWTGADLGDTEVTGHGLLPRLVSVSGSEQAAAELETRLEELQAEDVSFDLIGIIVPDPMLDQVYDGMGNALRRKCLRLDPSSARAVMKNKAVLGTASQFKGLERPIVIVLDIESSDSNDVKLARAYVATTRANYDLTVITDEADRYRPL